MNGVHDMGGMHGFGPVLPEADEPVFHEDWEREVFATVVALMAQGVYNLDEFRHAVERIGHAEYLAGSYYEHWLAAAELLLREKGLVGEDELAERIQAARTEPGAYRPPAPADDDPLAAALAQGVHAGVPAAREIEAAPRFGVDDAVVTRNLQPAGHIRLPAYVRDKPGRIAAVHGAFVLPDSHAHGRGEQPEYLYSVRFEDTAVWGVPQGSPRTGNYVDLWESYLEADPHSDTEAIPS